MYVLSNKHVQHSRDSMYYDRLTVICSEQLRIFPTLNGI